MQKYWLQNKNEEKNVKLWKIKKLKKKTIDKKMRRTCSITSTQ